MTVLIWTFALLSLKVQKDWYISITISIHHHTT